MLESNSMRTNRSPKSLHVVDPSHAICSHIRTGLHPQKLEFVKPSRANHFLLGAGLPSKSYQLSTPLVQFTRFWVARRTALKLQPAPLISPTKNTIC